MLWSRGGTQVIFEQLMYLNNCGLIHGTSKIRSTEAQPQFIPGLYQLSEVCQTLIIANILHKNP